MSRAELINVARSLNAKLPAAMALDVSPRLPTSFIRSAIELVVGIRGADDVRQREKEEGEEDVLYLLESMSDLTISPPTSPLAMRGKNFGGEGLSAHVTPRLERLEEDVVGEEEGVGTGTVVIKEVRYQKRRKVLGEVLGPLADVGKAATAIRDVQTPPRMRRAQSDRITTRASGIPIPRRVLRSQSQKIETAAQERTGIDMSFVNTQRPVYRYKSKAKQGDGEGTGERTRARVRPVVARQRYFGPSTPEKRNKNSAASNSSHEEDSSGTEAAVIGVKRKRSTEVERQMAAGIERMNIRV